jgi:hypothetical protein
MELGDRTRTALAQTTAAAAEQAASQRAAASAQYIASQGASGCRKPRLWLGQCCAARNP